MPSSSPNRILHLLPSALIVATALFLSTASLRADDSPRIADAKGIAKKLADGKYEEIRTQFDASMSANLSAEKMKTVWEAVIQQTGEFHQVSDAKSQTNGELIVVDVLCECATANIVVRVAYNPSARISGLYIQGFPKPPK